MGKTPGQDRRHGQAAQEGSACAPLCMPCGPRPCAQVCMHASACTSQELSHDPLHREPSRSLPAQPKHSLVTLLAWQHSGDRGWCAHVPTGCGVFGSVSHCMHDVCRAGGCVGTALAACWPCTLRRHDVAGSWRAHVGALGPRCDCACNGCHGACVGVELQGGGATPRGPHWRLSSRPPTPCHGQGPLFSSARLTALGCFTSRLSVPESRRHSLRPLPTASCRSAATRGEGRAARTAAEG